MSRNRTCRRGFTLVELLVVIGIIALLIAILMPSLKKAREAAQTVQCSALMRGIGQAIHLYASENKQSFPPTFGGYANANPTGSVSTPWFVDGTDGTLFLGRLTKYGIKVNDARICPVVLQTLGATMVANRDYWNYRYNAVLGGTQYPNRSDQYFSYDYDAVTRVARPRSLKMGSFKNSSNTAMISESLSLGTWAAATGQQFRLDRIDANGQQNVVTGDWDVLHSVKYPGETFWVPWAPNIRPKKIGILNVCFVDGSVRGLQVKWDQHPAKPWADGDIKIDPRR